MQLAAEHPSRIRSVFVVPGLAVLAFLDLGTGCSSPAGTHRNLMPTLWTGTSAEYAACACQTYRSAMRRLDEALSDPTWTACIEQDGDVSTLPPAVILDVDETVLDNTRYAAREIIRAQPLERSNFTRWVNEAQAPLVPGARQFINYARDKGVRVFFVTNRIVEEEEGTRENLKRVGIALDADRDAVLVLDERPEWTRDKSSRRRFVAEGHRILLLIGDDLNDFVSAETSLLKRTALMQRHWDRWGVSWFALPNPQYGSWLQALYGFDRGLPEKEMSRRLLDELEELD
jgi:acid phosphatase